LNYCGIRGDFLDYTVDRSPYKQWQVSAGTHIPIFSPERIAETRPDYILILPWNLKDEIVRQLQEVRGWGAGWSSHPEVAVLLTGPALMRQKRHESRPLLRRFRLRSATIRVDPKPMVPIGYRPILWHIMKYYAHYGHKDFILCLGWRGDVIKEYFLNYNECLSNDFVLSGGAGVDLRHATSTTGTSPSPDTGTTANIGARLKAVEHYLDGDEVFLANYADNVADFHLPD